VGGRGTRVSVTRIWEEEVLVKQMWVEEVPGTGQGNVGGRGTGYCEPSVRGRGTGSGYE